MAIAPSKEPTDEEKCCRFKESIIRVTVTVNQLLSFVSAVSNFDHLLFFTLQKIPFFSVLILSF